MSETNMVTEEKGLENGQMVSIDRLSGYKFIIPSYQRGFRWGKQQIKQLLDDLYEFYSDKDRATYCLQPIVVCKVPDEKNIYEVIDGQQRLTAMWILQQLHRALERNEDYANIYFVPEEIYTIEFAGKENYRKLIEGFNKLCGWYREKECSDAGILNGLIDEVLLGESAPNAPNIEKVKELKKEISEKGVFEGDHCATNDIDSQCFIKVVKEILGYSYIYVSTGKDTIWKEAGIASAFKNWLFTYKPYHSASVDRPNLEKEISFIWQDITPTTVSADDADDRLTAAAIDKFTNINANKIPLTASELIKAHFLGRLDGADATEFSLKWEEIDRRLSDDKLWYFFYSEDRSTRMDVLFRVWLKGKGVSMADMNDTSRRVVSDEVNEELKKVEKTKDGVISVWRKIVEIYDTLLDWYNDYYTYHMIGLLVELSKESKEELISELYAKYNESSKSSFREHLKKEIRNSMPFLLAQEYRKRSEDKSEDKWKELKDAEELLPGGDDAVSYKKNKENVKPVLLCYNIALLVNAYETNQQNSAERFPFEFYKNTETPIEIEHINPQHLEGKKDNWVKSMQRWADDTIEIINDDDAKRIISEHRPNDCKDNKQWERFCEEIKEAAGIDELSNLTLLDKKLNISCRDKFFDGKRNNIIAARFGLNKPDKQDETYNQSVIFPGTMWVFMRQYVQNENESVSAETGSAVNVTGAAAENISADTGTAVAEKSAGDGKSVIPTRWNADDREAYMTSIRESIWKLLVPEVKTTEKSDQPDPDKNGEEEAANE